MRNVFRILLGIVLISARLFHSEIEHFSPQTEMESDICLKDDGFVGNKGKFHRLCAAILASH